MIVPWIIWSVCFNFILYHDIPDWRLFFGGGYKHLWFLLMLFWLFLVSPIFNYYCSQNSRIAKYGFLVLLIMFSWLFTRNPFRQAPLLFSVSITYMCFFYLGCLLTEHRLHINNVILLTNVFGYFILPVIKLPMDLNILMSNIIVVCIIICVVDKLENIFLKDSYLLFSLSKSSMGIYIFHHVIIDVLLTYTWIVSLLNNFQWCPFFLFVFVFFISWLISNFFFLNKYLKALI